MKNATPVSSDQMPWCRFERKPDETLRGALERTLRDAILSGALRPGVRLPASRRLAEDLGVSRGVVTDAYGQLIAQGFLLTLGRTAPVTASLAPPPKHDARPLADGVRVRYDLSPTTPDVSLFRVRRWLTTALKAGQGVAAASLDYCHPGGELALREALADHLGRTRGVIADPAQIVITHGTAQGIDLLLRILRTRRLLRVAVEDPSHTGQRIRIGAAGLTLVPQNVDADGLLVDGLRADAVILTPAHQFPTGAVLSEERRHRLLAWADAANAVVVEDDYDAEFRYDREPVRALQGLAPDRVIQLGTVSKTLVPALRLGWMVVPPELLEDVLHQKAVVDEFTPTLDQLTLAAYLRSGEYDRHVRKARAAYRARRDRLVQELGHALPDLAVTGIAAGLHALLLLPPWIDDAAIAARALEREIRVSPLSRFCVTRTDARGLVLGYGRLHESAAVYVVRALEGILRPYLRAGPGAQPAELVTQGASCT